MSVRSRAVGGLVGFIAFVAIASAFEARFWSAWWFYVGLGMTISAVFLEPFFHRPQDAIVNGAGAVGAFWAAGRSDAELLWGLFAAAAVAVMVAGISAATLPDRLKRTKAVAYRFATTLGKAVLLGGSALVLAGIANLESGGQYLVIATLTLVGALVIRWTDLIALFGDRGQEAFATAVTAFGPRMLLVDAAGTEFDVGDRTDVRAGNRSAGATIISRMPHRTGMRYQLALDVEWHKLCRDFPSDLRVVRTGSGGRILGTVGEGTTDRRIRFEPVHRVKVGDPVSVNEGGRCLLYQVTSVELRRVGWEGSTALIPHATAMHVGIPEDGFVRFEPALPMAHEVIESASGEVMQAPDGYARLGFAVGTKVEVGIDLTQARQGHLAILGMSGMGKTSVAKRVCEVLAESCWVLALDTTGEYRSRLAFDLWDEGFDGTGVWVHEPAGDPPQKARELIEKAMHRASEEYSTGVAPRRRVVLLEEAHGFVPEWNFAARSQQDQVSYSARMVMQARKFELSFIVVSQRTAVVSKSVLSQCENYVILKTVDETSLSYLEGIFGAVIREAVPSLERYEAICAGPAFNSEGPIIVRLDSPDYRVGTDVSGATVRASSGR